MTTYYARKNYEYTGGDTNFGIPFPYINKDHIKVLVNDEEIENYTFNNDSQITITDTLTVGDIVSVVRNTPIDAKFVTFSNTSILRQEVQNLAQDQVFNAVQEVYDNNIVFERIVSEDIEDISDTATLALTNSETAVTTATSADSKADTAVSTANTASTNASNAVSTANLASSAATSAVNTANSASSTATAASNKVDSFGEDIAAVIEAAEKINELEEAVQTAVGAASAASDKATIASNKATEATNAANRAEAAIPSQTGQNGKFLQTNGTSTSWAEVDTYPTQTGQSGKFLTTDGSNVSWATVDALPTQAGNSDKFLTTDGTTASWGTIKIHNLLEFMWSDHILNDVSWLRADTFSWQSGDVYTSAYNHLVDDLQGTTAETETIGSYTVTFYRATDGHKICLADQEQTVLNIYNESGIAWYYIVDTTNTQFKLPRTKFGFEGLRTNVGDKIDAGLPNITGVTAGHNNITPTGAFARGSGSVQNTTTTYSNGTIVVDTFDASRSSSIYGNSTTVQEQATQMYLYFYVGDYTQSAIEQTAGLNSELFNGKADVDLANCTKPHIVESYVNGTSWYRVYSDGWCEQGGVTTILSGGTTLTFLKPFANTNYQGHITERVSSGSNIGEQNCNFYPEATTYAKGISGLSSVLCQWQACGYIN